MYVTIRIPASLSNSGEAACPPLPASRPPPATRHPTAPRRPPPSVHSSLLFNNSSGHGDCSCLALPCSLVFPLDRKRISPLLGIRLNPKGDHPHSPLLLSSRPLTTTKHIFVKQGADSNQNMANCGHLFEDEIQMAGSSLESGVHMVHPWTSTGAEPTCEYSLHSLYFNVLVFDGRQVVAWSPCFFWRRPWLDTSSTLTPTSRQTQRRMFD